MLRVLEAPRPLMPVPLPLGCGRGQVRVTDGRGQAARLLRLFRKSRDARVRVQGSLARRSDV